MNRNRLIRLGGSIALSIRPSQGAGILGYTMEDEELRLTVSCQGTVGVWRSCCEGHVGAKLDVSSGDDQFDISSSTSTPILPLGSPHIQFTEGSLSRLYPSKFIFQLKEEQKTHLVLPSFTELANSTNNSRLKCDSLTQF